MSELGGRQQVLKFHHCHYRHHHHHLPNLKSGDCCLRRVCAKGLPKTRLQTQSALMRSDGDSSQYPGPQRQHRRNLGKAAKTLVHLEGNQVSRHGYQQAARSTLTSRHGGRSKNLREYRAEVNMRLLKSHTLHALM